MRRLSRRHACSEVYKIIFRSLLREMHIRPAVWLRRLQWYWLASDKDGLALFAMLALPVAMLGLIAYLAFATRASFEGSHADAARRRAVDLHCLAENIYFEARGEPLEGQYAVAEVTMNRLASPFFPDSVCEVVHDTRRDVLRRRLVAHFSWTELERKAEPAGPAWEQAMTVAAAVYDEVHTPVVPDALFYHATSVQPYWSKSKRIVARIGNHVFYR
jgi:spore germination cell wall hydrolase CwlJ-like protein